MTYWPYLLLISSPFITFAYLSFRNMRKQKRIESENPMKIDMSGKVVVITGANCGIGYETALALAQKNATVVLAGRDQKSNEEAILNIIKESGNSKISFRALDLSSFDSIREFVKKWKSSGMNIDVLICNAGHTLRKKTTTKDGFESIFGVNHLGHFLLVNLLLDDLNKAQARIIVLSSSLSKRSQIDVNDLNWEKRNFDGMKAYSDSKLANILFAYELQRKINLREGPKAKVFAVHPGVAPSRLSRNSQPIAKFIFEKILPYIVGKTVKQAAMTSVYCAITEGIKEGRYYGDCKEEQSCPLSYDRNLASELWTKSCQMTGIVE